MIGHVWECRMSSVRFSFIDSPLSSDVVTRVGSSVSRVFLLRHI
jgi:hypothetical protein